MLTATLRICIIFNCFLLINSVPILISNSILEEIQENGISRNDTNSRPKVTSMIHAVEFMKKFGYLDKEDGSAGNIISQDEMRQKLKMVQKFGAIPQTGELDAATLKLMQSPRCGMEDVDGNMQRRNKRFIIGSDGWNKRRLTYHVANWSGKLWSKKNVQQELRKAFDVWAKYSYLKFTEVDHNQADIIIFFATYDHQDGYPFDGMGGTLAHAFYPYELDNYGGDIHFDDSEDWKIKPKDEYSGLEFFSVAVHEIGHSLGLSHSPIQESIMFPYYKGRSDKFALGYDDILGMWELYISRRLDGDDEYFKSTTTLQPSTITTRDVFQNDGAFTTSTTCTYGGCRGERVPETSTDDFIYYHGDSKTVDEHEEQFGHKKPDLPSLPPLQPEDDVRRRKEYEKRRKEARRRQEERREEERRNEEKRKEEERKRHEEEILRRERARRRHEEERRREDEERKRQEDEFNGGRNPDILPPSTTKENLTPPDICEGRLDAIASIRGEIVIFKGKYVWRYYRRRKPIPGNPALINSLFQGLPVHLNKVDAVYERKNDSNIIFFIGKYYYVHNGRRLLGDAHPITDFGVPESLTKLDAAFHWAKNNRTYLFSQILYWRRNDMLGKMDDNYPKSMSNWNGIPGNLDGAITDNYGVTHFLKGGHTWSYDNGSVAPDRNSPRRIRSFWMSC